MSSIIPGIIACGSRNQIAAVGACDDYWDDVVLLMHMDTNFTDETGKTTTPLSGAVITSAESKFGGESATGGGVTVSYTTVDFDWWTDDYTVECWVKRTAATNWEQYGAPTLIGNRSATSNGEYWAFGPLNNGKLYFGYWNGSWVGLQSSDPIVDIDTAWVHLSMTHTGGTIRIFADGIKLGESTVSGTPQASNTYPLAIFKGGGLTPSGYIDELRITKGVARYIADTYVVPTAPFGEQLCFITVPPVPAFVITEKVVVTEEPPEFIPNPTAPALTGAGGRMLTILGDYAYCVDRNVQDEVVMFNKTTLEVISRDGPGGVLRILDLCSNGSNKIYALFDGGVLVYQPTGSSLNKVLTKVIADGKQLKYASGSLFLRKSSNIQKFNSTTLNLEIETTVGSISQNAVIDTDGTDLYVDDWVNDFFIKINGSTSAITTYDVTGTTGGFQLVINNHAYFTGYKLNLTTGVVSSHSLSLTYSGDVNNTFISKFNNIFSHYVGYSGSNVYGKGTIRIIDSTDDSIVSTITNFEELLQVSCGNICIYNYKKPTGVGLLSETKLIISNGTKSGDDSHSSGYSVYELQ